MALRATLHLLFSLSNSSNSLTIFRVTLCQYEVTLYSKWVGRTRAACHYQIQRGGGVNKANKRPTSRWRIFTIPGIVSKRREHHGQSIKLSGQSYWP